MAEAQVKASPPPRLLIRLLRILLQVLRQANHCSVLAPGRLRSGAALKRQTP